MMKQIKHSQKREDLIKLLQATDSHPDADWIYSRMREIYPDITVMALIPDMRLSEKKGYYYSSYYGKGR